MMCKTYIYVRYVVVDFSARLILFKFVKDLMLGLQEITYGSLRFWTDKFNLEVEYFTLIP